VLQASNIIVAGLALISQQRNSSGVISILETTFLYL
jgi:hypothetical protein